LFATTFRSQFAGSLAADIVLLPPLPLLKLRVEHHHLCRRLLIIMLTRLLSLKSAARPILHIQFALSLSTWQKGRCSNWLATHLIEAESFFGCARKLYKLSTQRILIR